MNKTTDSEPEREQEVSGAQQRELLRRSEAHRRAPHEVVPLDEALDEIERSLTPPR